jgi:hypothetical protein
VTQRILELGKPFHGVFFYRQGKVVASFSFAGIHPLYPFIIALSQACTERLLANALEAAGGHIERGVRLVGCQNTADRTFMFSIAIQIPFIRINMLKTVTGFDHNLPWQPLK